MSQRVVCRLLRRLYIFINCYCYIYSFKMFCFYFSFFYCVPNPSPNFTPLYQDFIYCTIFRQKLYKGAFSSVIGHRSCFSAAAPAITFRWHCIYRLAYFWMPFFVKHYRMLNGFEMRRIYAKWPHFYLFFLRIFYIHFIWFIFNFFWYTLCNFLLLPISQYLNACLTLPEAFILLLQTILPALAQLTLNVCGVRNFGTTDSKRP